MGLVQAAQSVGSDAREIEHPDQPVEGHGPHRPTLPVPSAGGHHLYGDDLDLAGALESADEVEILEDRPVAKPRNAGLFPDGYCGIFCAKECRSCLSGF